MWPFSRRPFVPVLRFHGPIGMATPLRPGLTLAAYANAIEKAFLASKLPAVAVIVNSPGGSPVQSNLLVKRIRQLAAEQKKRVYVFCEDVAASGGYFLAIAGDEIYADPSSIIGSIGVVAGMPNFVGLMHKMGVRYLELTAGENKRTLTPFSEPTPQKEAIELERLQAIHTAFKNLIKQRRPNLDIDKVADGNYWLAVDAKELGLVDVIQTSDEYLSQQSRANRRILKISCKPEKTGLLEKLLDAVG